MCGIAGMLRFDGRPVESAVLDRMTDVLSHRGPDARGIHVEGALGLGHRRLSIIDLSDDGRQPINRPSQDFARRAGGRRRGFHLSKRSVAQPYVGR